MTDLKDVTELVRESAHPMPGESAAYREARNALLAEEIELRRHKERVAAMRRALPEGPEAPDYRFIDAEGREVSLADLFGEHDSLYTYFWMFGPERKRACPMCTDFLASFDGVIPNIEQRTAFAVLGRSPVSRQLEFARSRGWDHLRFYQLKGDAFADDHGLVGPDGGEMPWGGVWTRRDGVVRRFWTDEMSAADPEQDPRGALDPTSLWAIFDLLPEGRGGQWYPKLSYPPGEAPGTGA